MIILMKFLFQDDGGFAFYSFGIDEDKMDGVIRINIYTPMSESARIIRNSLYINNNIAVKGLIRLRYKLIGGISSEFKNYRFKV